MAFKFVHTADLHLDSPLKSLALRDQNLADLIGTASRTALSRIVDLCLGEEVQALMIAGDLYDGSQTSIKTAQFLAQELGRLDAAGIEVFIVRGNHDALSKITRELVLPERVKVFGSRAEIAETVWNGHAVAVHGVSFRKPQAPDSLLDRFKPAVAGAFNIGLLHTSLGGAAGHDPYAPCSVAELQQTGFDYWALGHIHRRSAVTGRTTVVMPGIPQGRDIGESGAKSVTLVEVDDDGGVTLAERSVAVACFERLALDCAPFTDWGDLVDALKGALIAARRDHPAEQLILRPVLTGATPLAWRARRDADLLLAEAQRVAEGTGSLWVEKIEIALRQGDGDRPAGALGDLARSIDDSIQAIDDARSRAEMQAVTKLLPRGLRGLWGDTPEDVAQSLQSEMRQGATEVLSRLATRED